VLLPAIAQQDAGTGKKMLTDTETVRKFYALAEPCGDDPCIQQRLQGSSAVPAPVQRVQVDNHGVPHIGGPPLESRPPLADQRQHRQPAKQRNALTSPDVGHGRHMGFPLQQMRGIQGGGGGMCRCTSG